jgi:S-adenosylmethionine hydrolase
MVESRPDTAARHPLLLMTDFGLRDRFVASMKGVAAGVDASLAIYDLSHDIAPFDILEGAVTLADTLPWWPAGSVAVAVVDPGVGTDRLALGMRTRSGHLVVAPDNGLLSFVEQDIGFDEVRVIEERMHRLPGSHDFHTFHGRDLFVWCGARLAAGRIGLSDLGLLARKEPLRLDNIQPTVKGAVVQGIAVKVEQPFGNLCTNIRPVHMKQAGLHPGDRLRFSLRQGKRVLWQDTAPWVETFGRAAPDALLAYTDSAGRIGLALNRGNLAHSAGLSAGTDRVLEVRKEA